MDLDQLRLFVDLVQEKSFTRVAQRHFVTQPAVSLRIRKLEQELGVRLLERTTRRLLVTDEGRLLYEHALEILSRVDQIGTIMRERQEQVVGSISLATVHSVGLYELPLTLREFIRRFPAVHLHMEYQISDDVYRSVLEGRADVGLVAYPEQRAGITSVPFFEDELILICNPDHPFALRSKVTMADLEGQPFVAYETSIPTRRAIDAMLNRHNVEVDVRMQCDNIELLKKMVEVGLGIALAPLMSIRQEQQSGALRAVPLAAEPIRRPLALIHRKGKALSRPLQAFVSLMTTEGRLLLGRHQAEMRLGVRSP